MEKLNAGTTLQEAIKEAQEDQDIYELADPMERAAAIADWLDREYPFSWTLKSRQDAAARAVGVPTNRELEKILRQDEAIEDKDPDQIKIELLRVGLSFIGASGLFIIGDQYPGALGIGLLGCALIILSKTLDKSEETAIMTTTRKTGKHERKE